jgi:hypothetical protein
MILQTKQWAKGSATPVTRNDASGSIGVVYKEWSLEDIGLQKG